MWRQGHRVPPREEAGAAWLRGHFPYNEFTIFRCAAGAHRACARGTMPRAPLRRTGLPQYRAREPRGRGSRSCAANPTVPHAPHTTSTRPCAGITARPASNTRAALPAPGRASRAVPAKDRKGAYSHTHSAGFPGTHAGSDECYVFVCESRPVKLWGLCIGAAARGREVPLTEVHRD